MFQADVDDDDLESFGSMDLDLEVPAQTKSAFPPKFIEVRKGAPEDRGSSTGSITTDGDEASVNEVIVPRRVSMYGSEPQPNYFPEPQLSLDPTRLTMPANIGRNYSIYRRNHPQQQNLIPTHLPASVSSCSSMSVSRCRVRFNRIDATGKYTGSTYFSKTRKETLEQLRENFESGVPVMNPFKVTEDEAEAIRDNQKYFQVRLGDDVAEWDAWKHHTIDILAEPSDSNLELTIELKNACYL